MPRDIDPEANKAAETILEVETQHAETQIIQIWLHLQKCQRVIWWVAYKSDRRRPVWMKVCTSLGSWRRLKRMGPKSSYHCSNTLDTSSSYRVKELTVNLIMHQLTNSSKLHLPLGSMALVRWALSIRASTSPTTMSTVCCNQRSYSGKPSSHHLIVKQRQTELTPIRLIMTK